jgi:RecA/RadA recombinase
MLAMQIMAEAVNSPHFQDYRLLYADVEGGARFDPALFGKKLDQKLEYVTMHNGEPFQTVEDFYAYLDAQLRKKKPFICVLDSMDALSSTSEMERFDANVQQRQKDLDNDKAYTNLSMGYGDGKAKVNSTSLRRIRNQLPVSGSILIILCQEREAITGMVAGNRVRSGGKALTFYADYEIWFSMKGKLERTIDGHKRTYGQETGVQIKKNRITGIRTDLKFPILQGVGISDTDAVLDWLMEEGVIQTPQKSNSKITINQDMLPPNI